MSFEPTHSEHSEKHKKSKKKKKKKDREKRHKHHKKDRHHRRESSAEEATMMDDDDSSQLMTESAQLYYSAMSTSSAISSNPVTKPMIPMQEHPRTFHNLTNVPSLSSMELKPETPIHDSPMTPSSMDSVTREPRTCVLKLKQSRSPLSKLLDHLLKALEKRDPHQFFAWPVTDDIAPGYSAIITRPMDFSTIRQKIEENEYHLLTDFIDDFRLMCDNAIRYNHHETVYNKAARRLLQAGLRLLLPENLTRGPVAVFIKDLTVKELGFDPTIKMEHHDETYSVDSADETGNAATAMDQPDPLQEERERRQRMKVELDPKTPYEPFVDNLTADEVLEQAKKAARDARARLNKKKAHSMGFLRSQTDGTTSMTILVPSESGIPEKTRKLGDFTGKLQKGTGLLQSFREDRRNIVKLPKTLDYGAFSSFAPTFDSRFTNLTKDETELMLNTYGDESGVNYATSIGRFTNDSAYGSTLANRLLDLLTNGDHSKTMEQLMESENVKQTQKQVEELLPDYQKESKRLEGVSIDFDQLKSLRDLGLDTGFLGQFEKSLKGVPIHDIQTKLDTNTSLIEKLHQTQHERLSAPVPQHLGLIQHPNKQEIELAEQITSNLTSIAKKLPPCAIASPIGIRKAMGVTPVGIEDDFRKIPIGFQASISGSKESLVDTTPMDMDLEPPATSTFDNELRELLGTD